MIKILTIDDETAFTELFREYFEPRGYQVFLASRGVQGLEIAKQEKPNIALVDFKMPGIDGDQVLMQLKKINPEIKVLIVTAFRDEGKTKKKLEDLGADGFIEKPVESLKELEAKIRELVGKQ